MATEGFTKTAIVVVKNSKKQYLLLKRKNVWAAGCWGCPAGHVKDGETLQQTAARELFEETGLKCEKFVNIGSYSVTKGVHKQTGLKTDKYKYYFMKAENLSGSPTNKEPSKCEDLQWISPDEIRKLPLTIPVWYLFNITSK